MARPRFSRAKLLTCNNEILKHIGLQEALEMIASGQALRVSRIKAQSLVIRLAQPRTPDRLPNMTSITLSEMEANAGTMGGRRRARRHRRTGRLGNFVDRAMTKIELWPEIGDDKAARVVPRTRCG